jgi:hypothetical protein
MNETKASYMNVAAGTVQSVYRLGYGLDNQGVGV